MVGTMQHMKLDGRCLNEGLSTKSPRDVHTENVYRFDGMGTMEILME